MSTKWPMIQLAEVLRLYDSSVPVSQLTEINLAGIYSFGRGLFKRGPMSPSETSYKSYNRLTTDDYVISQPKAWEGALARVTPEFNGWFLSPVFPTFRANRNKLEPAYLDWFCKRESVWEELRRKSRGIGARRESVSPNQFLSLEIPLPHLDVQQRIVKRIEELATKIEKAQVLRRQAVEEVKVLLESQITWIFTRVAILASLGDQRVCRIICGQHLGPEDQSDSGIPYITGPADFGHRVAKPTRFARIAKVIAEPGDVLLTVKGAGIGKVNLAPEQNTAIGRQLFALRPNPDRLDRVFLLYGLQFSLQRFRDAMTATTVPGIGRDDVQQLEIPCPSIAEQRRIVAKLDKLSAEVDALKKLQAETADELDALLPSILDQAFKGEL